MEANNIKIALVEDQPIIKDGIRLLINQVPNMKVVAEFTDGQDFVDNHQLADYDIVVTDVDMPRLNGVQMVKQILSFAPQTKFIVLTMHQEAAYSMELIAIGVKGYVFKQSTSSNLVDAIVSIHAGQTYFSQELLLNLVDIKTKKRKAAELAENDKKLLQLMSYGYSNKKLADELFVSVKSIEGYKRQLYKSTGCKNSMELVVWAIKHEVVKV
ncbi:response regulator transcription factor [Carboxylicivirga marina]|uniref:Response regulator transcription factor n=1 Tax=Carboxylicivirga marina TaxID=2800988 RepID=A0ABS1HPI0_9BACT|nr:response regulator transcription factor [Carboxylicivirga marina]MBK3519582.1 response regulator transcription factor [Carboxylicivirga marina]